MHKNIFLIAAVLLFACTQRQSFVPVQGSAGSAVDSEIQREIFLQTKINPKQLVVSGLSGTGGEIKEELRGVVFQGLNEQKAKSIFDAVSVRLKSLGYKLFLTNLHFDRQLKSQWDLAVVKGYSDLDLLKKYDVSGPNYDITNAQVVAQVEKWQKHMKLEFFAFEQDRFEAKILSPTYDVSRLADENYKLCPDVIEQGYETREELIKGLGQERYLWCWWD